VINTDDYAPSAKDEIIISLINCYLPIAKASCTLQQQLKSLAEKEAEADGKEIHHDPFANFQITLINENCGAVEKHKPLRSESPQFNFEFGSEEAISSQQSLFKFSPDRPSIISQQFPSSTHKIPIPTSTRHNPCLQDRNESNGSFDHKEKTIIQKAFSRAKFYLLCLSSKVFQFLIFVCFTHIIILFHIFFFSSSSTSFISIIIYIITFGGYVGSYVERKR
jgi:hypothetical protein